MEVVGEASLPVPPYQFMVYQVIWRDAVMCVQLLCLVLYMVYYAQRKIPSCLAT